MITEIAKVSTLPKLMVSACLLGVECNYKGSASSSSAQGLFSFFKNAAKQGWLIIPVCPEQLGGLPTPRVPAEIVFVDGERRVVRSDGIDVTAAFLHGADEVLKIAKMLGVSAAVLKSRSPSCGVYEIYDGTFSRVAIKGQGVCADLLSQHGVKLRDDAEFLDALSCGDDLEGLLAWV